MPIAPLDFTAHRLANLADVSTPDAPDSPGAAFLLGVQSDVNALDERPDDTGDAAHEIADSAVPVYTHEMWQTFTDLAAWQEDMSDFGQPEDMSQGAMWALYGIARRLAEVLIAERFGGDEND